MCCSRLMDWTFVHPCLCVCVHRVYQYRWHYWPSQSCTYTSIYIVARGVNARSLCASRLQTARFWALRWWINILWFHFWNIGFDFHIKSGKIYIYVYIRLVFVYLALYYIFIDSIDCIYVRCFGEGKTHSNIFTHLSSGYDLRHIKMHYAIF